MIMANLQKWRGRSKWESIGCLKPNMRGKKLLSSLPASTIVRRSTSIFKQLAPKLISCSRLPGGWCAVIMEKIYGSMLNSPVSAEVKMALKTAVEVMHAKNFVHGDLRPQNILVVDNKVRLLDFDWAGNEGTARYPKSQNSLLAFWCVPWRNYHQRTWLVPDSVTF